MTERPYKKRRINIKKKFELGEIFPKTTKTAINKQVTNMKTA